MNEAIIAQIGVHCRNVRALPGVGEIRSVDVGPWADKGIVLDLRTADLSKSLWGSVELTCAVLNAANLFDIDLSEANLVGADLRWTDLRKADLSYSYLGGAQLENVIYDDDTRWPLGAFPLKGAVWNVHVGLPVRRPDWPPVRPADSHASDQSGSFPDR
ncbi:pentapeptide repeat-containing protein [Rhodococcus erythropolis]|uniref:pentapeptide repeat-containing protein n=1 Tax=Rhodococcus erythropolis TaxID=1833 RepID=UPI0037B3D605